MLILTFLITIIQKQFTPYKLNCTIQLLWLLKKTNTFLSFDKIKQGVFNNEFTLLNIL